MEQWRCRSISAATRTRDEKEVTQKSYEAPEVKYIIGGNITELVELIQGFEHDEISTTT